MGNQTEIFDFLGDKVAPVEEETKYKLTVSVARKITSFKKLYFEFDSLKDLKSFKSKLKIYSSKESRTSNDKERLFIIVAYPNAFINQYIEKRG